MKAKKKKVEACIDPAKRDIYLYNGYGITFEEHEKKNKRQKNKCAICRRPPANLPLAQDHWHKLARCKVRVWEIDKGLYFAWNDKFDELGYKLKTAHFMCIETSRTKAMRSVVQSLKRLSSRGQLCWACNTGLQKWRDHPENILRAAKYLQSYMKGLQNGLDYCERT